MKKILFLIGAVMLMAGCTIQKNYYFSVENDADMAKVRNWLETNMKDIKSGGVKAKAVRSSVKSDVIHYDEPPVHIRSPRLLHSPESYNPEDQTTFPVYTDVQTVAGPLDSSLINRIAIWCTKNATYLAQVTEQHWDMHYHQLRSGSYIRDSKTGKKYYVIDHCGLPLDKSFHIKGVTGQYVCLLAKYPPLPPDCTRIDIIEDDVKDNVKNGLSWSGGTKMRNVSIATLQANQHITIYREVKVIE